MFILYNAVFGSMRISRKHLILKSNLMKRCLRPKTSWALTMLYSFTIKSQFSSIQRIWPQLTMHSFCADGGFTLTNITSTLLYVRIFNSLLRFLSFHRGFPLYTEIKRLYIFLIDIRFMSVVTLTPVFFLMSLNVVL